MRLREVVVLQRENAKIEVHFCTLRAQKDVRATNIRLHTITASREAKPAKEAGSSGSAIASTNSSVSLFGAAPNVQNPRRLPGHV